MKTMKRIKKASESGQSLVELAFSLIVLLYLLLGAVEFGIALFQYISIRDAAQEGALYGSINPTNEAEMQARAIAAAADVTPLTTSNVVVSWNNPSQKCEGSTLVNGQYITNTVTVSITFDHEIFLPLVGDMIGNDNIRLRGQVTDTILSPVCP
jgi:Flp pilus assembly protein TadG